jgi:hypothetical protein
MRSKHVYASVDLFKDYLAGDTYADNWGDDVTVIRTILESASRTIEAYVGDRSFAPYISTREYDLGIGELRNRSELPRDSHRILPTDPVLGVVPLDDWLTAIPTTVTAYDATVRNSSTVLTEGLTNDYILEPYPQAPYHTLKLSDDTTNNLSQGQKTLTILGSWGWQNEVLNGDTLNGSINATATTVIKTNADAGIYPGDTILIDSEQMYVRAKNGTNLTVFRGVNGTTAATHADDANIYTYLYPADVVEACLAIARDRWRSREAGTTAIIGAGGATIARPGAEVRAILRGLDNYKQTRDLAGMYF